jgi:ABC-2 type transport system ATP-binding protein
MTQRQLVCDATTKTFGGPFTLGPLSLTVGDGVTCLVGANGAGKSTFFRLVARVEKPTSGSVRVDAHGAALGYLPQEPQLPLGATCAEFLYYVAWLHRVPRADRVDAVDRALAQVRLTDRRDSRIRSLSGGMRRRLGVAHALVHTPSLLLLDEPTVGLDPGQRIAVREAVASVSRERIVIVSTHLVEDVRGLADRVLVLNEGTLVFDGDVPALERAASDDAPGDSPLERAIATLIGVAG